MDAPHIARAYARYIRGGSVADFIHDVTSNYTLATLHRLADHANVMLRRAALLAIGYFGNPSSVAVLGEALHDHDRSVRLIAEHGLKLIWSQPVATSDGETLQSAIRSMDCGDYDRAVESLSSVINQLPDFAEAYYQRANGLYAQQRWREAITDAQLALQRSPYHYPSAMLLGRCHLQLQDPTTAASCYYWALQIHPHLELARLQLRRLKRDIGGRLG